MKLPKGYYVINHYYPEVTREKLSKAIELISDKKNLNDNEIEALKELRVLYEHYTASNLKLHSKYQMHFLKSLKK